jgi:hypothetical protein
LARYLLGDLPESEQTAFELEYLADPETFEEVWAAENDLVDRYVRGWMSTGEREMFERNYMRSPRHVERVAFARSLLEAAAQAATSPTPESGLTWWSQFKATLMGPGMLRAGLAAAASLLLISAIAWLAIERGRLNREIEHARARLSEQERRGLEITDELAAERDQSASLESEIERLRQEIARARVRPDQPDRPSVISMLLSPMLVRGEGGPQQVTIPRDTDLIQLQMRVDDSDSRLFEAVIRTVEGRQVWKEPRIRLLARAANRARITVDVPADRLPLGDYILTLSAASLTGESEEVNRYFFRVARP